MKDAVVLFSGGIDSTVLLYDVVNQGFNSIALSFDYGQKHARELESVQRITALVKVPHKIIGFPQFPMIFKNSALIDPHQKIPIGKYSRETLKQTVVPNRNMILISMAAAFAICHGAYKVYYAAHSGDHELYPDCRPAFVKTLAEALQLCDWSPVLLEAPFLHSTKADIIRWGAEQHVPFSYTWSCYEGQQYHCGKCSTCLERINAFIEAKIHDPTIYQTNLKKEEKK